MLVLGQFHVSSLEQRVAAGTLGDHGRMDDAPPAGFRLAGREILVSLAVLIAVGYHLAVVAGVPGTTFWAPLAVMLVVVVLGLWLERSLGGTPDGATPLLIVALASAGLARAAWRLVLPDDPALFAAWWNLVRGGVRGKRAHDARLVAWMRTKQVHDLLTFNAADFVTQLYDPLNKLAGPVDQFAEQLNTLATRFDQAIDKARDLGLETDKLTQARQRELDKATLTREVSALNIVAGQQNVLQGFLNGLALENATPETQLQEAQAQFGDALSAARSAGLGRADLQRVVGAGQSLIEAGRSFYASGPGSADLQGFVTSSIRSLGSQFDLPAFGGDLDRAVAGITGLTDEIGLLRSEVSRLREELRSARLLAVA
jgi:hypothetical protein